MRTGFIVLLSLLSQFIFSQDIPDETALFARTGITGTARTIGSAGAYGSVGADMGCISINPAGLGLYRSTDFSVTPMLLIGSSQTIYDGNNTFAHKPYFALSQGGFVFTKIFKKAVNNDNSQTGFSDHPLKSISFALNFQQTNNFDRSQQYGVNNTAQSITNGYANYLNFTGSNPSYAPGEIYVAGQANLIGYNSTTNTYFSNIKGPVSQTGDIETRGAINRIDFGLGTDFQDKLYFGFNLSVPVINYNINNDFIETPQNNPAQQFEINTLTSETGYGFNGILGLIYRPFSFMRIGAAYHLPTWYAMSENYQLGFNDDSITTGNQPLQAPAFKYGLRTPMKGTFSASFYYKQYGFISVDYEIQNLSSAMVHVPNDSNQQESGINSAIKSTYTYTHTVHAGLEAAIKIVRLRAGYAFSSSPFKKDQEFTPGYMDVRNAFTAGVGIRLKHFYVDVAYIYGWWKDASNQLTNIIGTSYNNVNSINNSSTVLLTIGWKFEAGEKNNNQQKRQQQRYTPPVDNDPKY